MKKLLALAMAGMMCAVAAPIHAAEEAPVDPQTDGDQSIETETATQEAKGQVWAMLSNKEALDQMKVTVPIRLHFAVLKADSTLPEGDENEGVLQFKTPHKEKYQIAVDKTSSVGVKVTKVTFEKPQNGKWSLVTDAAAAKLIEDDPQKVAIKLNNQWMEIGENPFEDADQLKVKPNEAKSLGFEGAASKSTIGAANGLYEHAFNVTYTLEMDKEEAATPTA